MATRLKFWWFDIVDTIGDDYHRWYITTDKDIYEYMSVYTRLDWVEETNIFGDLGLGDVNVSCDVWQSVGVGVGMGGLYNMQLL